MIRQNRLSKTKLQSESEDQRYEQTTKSWGYMLNRYQSFQPADEVEFPTKEGPPRIPHIMHQVLYDEYVIANYSKYIKSFTKHNPTWEYRFWTHESGRRLMAEKHPYLLITFDSLPFMSVKKTDFVKYVVMYEYGGFYSDIDVMNLRPLDIVTTKYACIIPPEPFEHSTFIYNMPVVLNSGIFLCRPKHPFFKMIVENLNTTSHTAHPLRSTGALKLTSLFAKYNNITYDDMKKPKVDNNTNTPYFYKGMKSEEADDSIYVPNSQYFLETIDPILLVDFHNETMPVYCKKLRELHHLDNLLMISHETIRACTDYRRRLQIRKNKKFTFTQHYWHHMWSMNTAWQYSLKKLHVRNIVPYYKSY